MDFHKPPRDLKVLINILGLVCLSDLKVKCLLYPRVILSLLRLTFSVLVYIILV